MNIRNIFRNISPAVAVMVVGVLGAYMVYNNYFSGTDTASIVGAVEPAAGDEAAAAPAAAPAADAAVAPAADAAAAVVAPKVDENGCLLNEANETTLDEAGNCVKPAPVPAAAEVTATPPTEGAEAAPAAAAPAAAPAAETHKEGAH